MTLFLQAFCCGVIEQILGVYYLSEIVIPSIGNMVLPGFNKKQSRPRMLLSGIEAFGDDTQGPAAP